MKRFLLSSILVFAVLSFQNILYSQINQDWKWVHPKPHGNNLRFVKAFSSTEWMVIGYNGTFMHTSNVGVNWDFYTNAGGFTPAKTYNSLQDGWFFNVSTGIVCGSNGYIARTTNAGLNWDMVSSGVASTLNGIHFVDASTGFIGYANNILKTTDAGLSWDSISLGVSASVNNIFALDVNHIYAPSSSGNLYVTKDGGVNWVRDSTGSGTLYDVNFLDANTGFVCGASGTVRITTNGGSNWTNIGTGVNSTYYSLYVTSSSAPASFDENFDGTAFPPTGWNVVNVLGNTVTWVRSVAQSHSSPASTLINYDCDSLGGLDWLITPRLLINAGDSLSFWIRTNDFGYPPDSLCVRVSTTDTALSSFTTRILYLAEGLNYPDTTQWGRYAVSLNSFAGQNIYVGFKHQDACGDGIYLDDVHIGSTGSGSAAVYVVGDTSRIFKSINFGTNWTAIDILSPSHKWTNAWYSMDINGSTMVVAGANGTINYSANGGTNWSELNSKISGGTLYDVWCENGTSKVWAVGSSGKSGIYFDQVLYSSNGGATFTNQDVGSSIATYRSLSMVNSSTGYICGNFSAVRKTINGGVTWDSIVTPIPTPQSLYKIDFTDANTGWVFSNAFLASGTIWHTTNGGVNWTQQALTDTLPNGPRIYSAYMVDANLGFCTNGYSAIHMTTNGGDNWVLQTLPVFFGPVINDICMINDNSGYLVGSNKLLRTQNQWLFIDTIQTPLTSTLIATKWVDEYNGFVVSSSGFVVRTTNRGDSWEFMPTSANSLSGMYAKTQDTAYVVGSGGTVLKLQKGPVGISWTNKVPVQYYLEQNYPNPFNPVTQFKFGLSGKAKVNLKVYDVTGRLVQTFFDNVQLNAGTVTVKFDGTNIASGIYFYTLMVDDNRIDTKKMVLLK
jgi:photosystem II stability/assembly factor-like uncharacterized protein